MAPNTHTNATNTAVYAADRRYAKRRTDTIHTYTMYLLTCSFATLVTLYAGLPAYTRILPGIAAAVVVACAARALARNARKPTAARKHAQAADAARAKADAHWWNA